MHDNNTKSEFTRIHDLCLDVFVKKMSDYGTSWRLMRLPSLTDQIYIKARRIRSIEEKHEHKVAEGIGPEFIGIVNYGVIALIQCKLKPGADLPAEEAKELYNDMFEAATSLMCDKNHDYDEAWRSMRISSYTDLILMKIYRTKQIESLSGNTLVSEGIDANYMDMINYSVFGLIKIEFEG